MGTEFFHLMPNVDYLVISRRVGSSLEVGRPKGCEAAAACPRAKRGFFLDIYHPGSVLAGFQLSRHSAY